MQPAGHTHPGGSIHSICRLLLPIILKSVSFFYWLTWRQNFGVLTQPVVTKTQFTTSAFDLVVIEHASKASATPTFKAHGGVFFAARSPSPSCSKSSSSSARVTLEWVNRPTYVRIYTEALYQSRAKRDTENRTTYPCIVFRYWGKHKTRAPLFR